MRICTKAIPRALAAFAFTILLLSPLLGGKKETAPTAKTVDSGTFGIFINGKRVASEKFQIEQNATSSVARSELLMADADKAAQTAELTLSPSGDLRRYEWKEISPEKALAVVEPNNEFLIERVTMPSMQKPLEQPYIMPTSTMIVDDYFFSHREILVWRYLAACQTEQGQPGCKLNKSQFGVLVPRQRVPMMVTIEYAGPEKITLKGQQVELNRFNMTADGTDWTLWFNPGDHKLMRILIASDNTEVIRD